VKFLSRKAPTDPSVTEPEPTSTVGKGHPTPTRKEAEAQRKQTLKVSSDPKAAKKAAKERAAQERAASRAALLAGDESALPPRDAGPVKRYVRDYIDSRWAAAELFMPLALLVLVVGFLPWRSWGLVNAQGYVSMLWLVLTLFILVDTTVLLMRMGRELKKQWPADADRKGATFYGLMRVLQIRRLRLPPPRLRRGGRPVTPK
jgi:Protein of unknown function (DUF3043)